MPDWQEFYLAFGGPKCFMGVTRAKLHDVAEPVLDSLDAWLTAFPARSTSSGLLLFGRSGGGKTIVASYLLSELLRQGRIFARAAFVSGVALSAEVSGTMRPGGELIAGVYDFYSICDLLIIDNVVPKDVAEHQWLSVHVLQIIRARFESNRPTILTSVFSPEDLLRWFGPTGGVALEACKPVLLDTKSVCRHW